MYKIRKYVKMETSQGGETEKKIGGRERGGKTEREQEWCGLKEGSEK